MRVYSVSFTALGDGTYRVTLVPLPEKEFVLLVVDGRPRLRTTINGKPAYIERVYVESKVCHSVLVLRRYASRGVLCMG